MKEENEEKLRAIYADQQLRINSLLQILSTVTQIATGNHKAGPEIERIIVDEMGEK